MGAQVTFQAQANGQTYDIGADLGILQGELELVATVYNSPAPGRAQIVENGQVRVEVAVEDGQATLGYMTQADSTASVVS